MQKIKKKNNKLNWNNYHHCRSLAYFHNVSQIKQQSEDMVCKTQKSIYPLNNRKRLTHCLAYINKREVTMNIYKTAF
jgi:hypothetical protein